MCAHTLGLSLEGVCDLIGNIAEWVLDNELSYTNAPTDGSPHCVSVNCGGSNQRIIRGGSYIDGPLIDASSRTAIGQETSSPQIGIRLILDRNQIGE